MSTKKNKIKNNVTKKHRVSVCASCLEFDMNKIVKSKDSLKPSWLTRHDYVKDFISKQKSFSIKKPIVESRCKWILCLITECCVLP